MKYQYRRGGANYGKVPAGIAARELERIRKESGRLRTEDVVQAARPGKAPLHPIIFDCNVDEAAEKHYLWNARMLVRNIVVVRSEGAEPEPLFIHVVLESEGEEGTKDQYYQSSRVIVNSATELQAAVDQSRLRVDSAQNSLADLLRIAKGSKYVKLIGTAVSHVRKAAGALNRVAAD